MPLYEYRCDDCGSLSELLQRVDDPPAETCSDCGGKLRKLISAPAFQFKGSGWYVTDYARSGEKGEKGDKAESTATSASETGKSEGKSDKSETSKSEKSSAATPV